MLICTNKKNLERSPSLLQSIISIVLLMGLIACNVLWLKEDTLGGANQLSLLIAAAVAASFALYNKISWEKLMSGIIKAITASFPAIMILLMVGALSGAWMLSGIIPTMIYWGLEILRPAYFLPTCVIICAAVSLATGSSWSTVATIGVALIGIGSIMKINPAYSAGAIISGAYFGDKISPLSDTTNLASAVAKTDIFVHIKYMLQTTTPSIIIAITGFILITIFSTHIDASMETVHQFQATIKEMYNTNLLLLLVVVVVVYLIMKKIQPVPVLFIGAITGIIVALIFQYGYIKELCGGTVTMQSGYEVCARALFGTTAPETGNTEINELLATRGMAGMLNTIWLIITAMIFGGTMEAGRFLERITQAILSKAKTAPTLVTSVTGTCALFNVTTGDQYVAIVVSGNMYEPAFQKASLEGRLLSRTLEDSGTVTSVLVPWNTCGATQASVLGVATAAYAPFAFFCWISPLMTLFFAWRKIGIKTTINH
jgi:NhaC family Na+:H+ antiporter